MDVTTIKLHKQTKNALEMFRSEHESYDRTIRKLIAAVRQKQLKKELIEAYQTTGKGDSKILEEWEIASNEIN